MRLNLGACDTHYPGFLNVDIVPPAQLVADLQNGWPFASDSIAEVLAFDVFEHLTDKRHTMNELYRVLKPNGVAHVRVPHATLGDGGFCDPTHRSYWTTSDFEYYVTGLPERERFRHSAYYGVRADFRVLKIQQDRFERKFGGHVVEILASVQALKGAELRWQLESFELCRTHRARV